MRILTDLNEIAQAEKCLNYAAQFAKNSTCERSKCGSVIVNDNTLIGRGFNSMPCNKVASCFKDGLDGNFKSDKTCCVHAEQRAIINALEGNFPLLLEGSRLYFIRLDGNDQPKKSGEPYCTICSKLALDVGVREFVLWHEKGITVYDTDEYNEYSFLYPNYKV